MTKLACQKTKYRNHAKVSDNGNSHYQLQNSRQNFTQNEQIKSVLQSVVHVPIFSSIFVSEHLSKFCVIADMESDSTLPIGNLLDGTTSTLLC